MSHHSIVVGLDSWVFSDPRIADAAIRFDHENRALRYCITRNHKITQGDTIGVYCFPMDI